jgi:uncharacterized membrane protein YfcA
VLLASDPWTLAVCLAGTFVIAFAKGAFGGGLALLGVPIFALAIDPITAGVILAPLFVAMDIVGLRYWKPSTWSRPDTLVLAPTLCIGIGIGALLLGAMNPRAVSVVIALITLAFAAHWVFSRGRIVVRPRSLIFGIVAGVGSGITTMIAHAGGPPMAAYLLRLGLPKAQYAGTMSIVFTAGNAVKVIPWLLIQWPTAQVWWLCAALLPAVPLGVWAGWRLHNRLDQRQLYNTAYVLLTLAALKLLWDGIGG